MSTKATVKDLIGSILSDVIDAESVASLRSLQNIKEMGFKSDKTEDEDNLGSIRLLSFTYSVKDENGNEVKKEHQVPLISLIPLPFFQISNLNLDCSMDIYELEESKDDLRKNKVAGLKDLGNFKHLNLYSSFVSTTPDKEQTKIPKGQINVTIGLKQSDLPAGIPAMLRVMDLNTREK